MIDYIKYTVDGKSYSLIDNGDGTWSKTADAPNVAGLYSILFEISENGIITFIDSSDSRYETYLNVIEAAERRVFLIQLIPEFMREISELTVIFDIEDLDLDEVLNSVERVKNEMFITAASNDAVTRLENFLRIKGQGTLTQRKSYLISLSQKGNKLNEARIKEIANTITGSDCTVSFFTASEPGNPESGQGLLRVQVLSPDNNKDYKYDDIARALAPLTPGHVKLIVIKYFSTWADIRDNFGDWNAVLPMGNWQAVKSYIPPQ